MTTSRIENPHRRSQRFWTSSILLLAQLLTVVPILLIAFTDERQSALSARCASLLQKLDQLAVLIKEPGAPAWQEQYSKSRGELDVILRNSPEIADVREIMLQMDATVNRMAQAGTPANLQKDREAALHAVGDAQRIVGLQLSLAANGIAEKEGYLKVLVAGACLLAFGLVFAFRRFRLDSATQRRLEQSLRSTNEEVLAALTAARDGSDAKNKLLINVSDAIRTPLNGMISQATRLLETELTSEQREYAQATLQSAVSLASVIHETVDFVKMEEGRIDLEVEEFQPSKVIEEALNVFRGMAGRKGLKLECVAAEGLPDLVKGDPGRLGQVLTNLIGNAVKFTERGRVMLSVTDAGMTEGKTKLRFEVKDTGIGISDQALSRLFKPFTQADGSIARKYGGAGLGLAISKRLVEVMGGELEVVSVQPSIAQAGGSTFWFTVMLQPVRAARKASSPSVRVITPLAIRPRPLGRDRRSELRYRINYPTLLKSKAAGVAIARVLDVAESGLRVAVPFRLPLHAEVEIRIDDTTISGFVRNCECVGTAEFHAGIEILQSDLSDRDALEDFVNKRTAKRLLMARAN
jgi:signal transduction histidine kinase